MRGGEADVLGYPAVFLMIIVSRTAIFLASMELGLLAAIKYDTSKGYVLLSNA